MKKSLIAVAALAAVGAASAQSSVTLYGVVDTGYSVKQVKTEQAGVTTKVRTTGLHSGGLSGSRWGLKGQEDLGNGLSAVFNVEAGFNSANGAFAATKDGNGNLTGVGGFNRRSVVGLKGGFGQVLLGRDYTPMDSIGSDYQASDLVTGDEYYGSLYTARANGVHYAGEFSGVGVKAFVGYNDEKTTTGGVTTARNRSEGYGVGVSYSGGPVMVGAAVQQFRGKVLGANTLKRTEYGVGATYDFNVAKAHAHYIARDGGIGATTAIGTGAVTVDSGDTKPVQQFGVGVTVPFGAFTLGAQYAYNYHKVSPATKAKGHDFVLQGAYALSKRTDVYARAARTDSWKAKTSGVTSVKTHTDSFAVGIRHRF